MLKLFVRSTTWLALRRDALSHSDRGAVSVETAIITGIVAAAALAVGAGITLLVTRKVGEWSVL